MWTAISAGKTWRGQLVNRRKDGTLYVDEATLTPILNGRGQPTHFASVRHDVTQQVQSRQQTIAEAETLTVPHQLDALAKLVRTRKELLSATLDVLLSLSEFRIDGRAVVFEYSPEENHLVLVMTRGNFEDKFLRDEATIPIGRCLCGRAALERQVLICSDCHHDLRHENRWPEMDTHGHYTIPLVCGDELFGVINLYTTIGTDTSERRFAFLTEVGQKVGAALKLISG